MIHAIAGLPRSGSTLLCNVLNQNPEFYASSTSFLPGALDLVRKYCSNSPEFKSYLINDPDTDQRLVKALRGFIDGWYPNKDTVVFDKSRGWNQNFQLFGHLSKGKIICLVRDLVDVYASIEKQSNTNVLAFEGGTQYDTASMMFAPQGIIGSALIGIEDAVRRNPPNVYFLQYEAFVESPEEAMKSVYTYIDMPYFEHQFENVVNTAEDTDALYLNKYPHQGSGKIEPKPKLINLHRDIIKGIRARGEFYNQSFGYA